MLKNQLLTSLTTKVRASLEKLSTLFKTRIKIHDNTSCIRITSCVRNT